MPSLDSKTLSELLKVLSPLLRYEDERRTLLWLAFGQNPQMADLLHGILWTGPVEIFILNVVQYLIECGTADSGKPVLWEFLETIYDRLSKDQKERIDNLQSIIYAAVLPKLIHTETQSEPHYLRVFLSSPTDVSNERNIAFRVLEQLPYDPLLRGKLSIEVVAWDKLGSEAPMLANMTPQEASNQGLPKPSDCDIVIVIFRSRMGTPLSGTQFLKSDGSRYLSGTEWEYEDAMQVSRKNDRPFVLVYRCVEEFSLKVTDPNFMEKYEQWKLLDSFFRKFSNQDGTIQQAYNTYKTPDEFRTKLENHLRELIRRLLIAPTKNKRTRLQNQPHKTLSPLVKNQWFGSPYPGLRSLADSDALIFHGRDTEIDNLVARLSSNTNQFLAVIGASGVGKSSLVWAGLIPQLKENIVPGSKDWLILRFTPDELGSGNPFEALAIALMRNMTVTESRVASKLADQPHTFDVICNRALSTLPSWTKIVLFVDQFEETFTLIDAQYRSSFLDMLAYLTSLSYTKVIVTLRSDFYAEAVKWAQMADLLQYGSYPLAPPSLTAMYQMITRPATIAGLHIEAGLVERLLTDVSVEPGALALLAYTLNELHRKCETDGLLSHEAYDALGGVRGSIGTQAKKVFSQLGEDAQKALPIVFRRLISVSEEGVVTRQRISLTEFAKKDDKSLAHFINAFTEARLLVQNKGANNQPIVEVAHEALFESWPMLKEWIDHTKDDLRLLHQVTQAANEWYRRDKDKIYLWPHERLYHVYDALKRLDISENELSSQVTEFIVPEAQRLIAETYLPTTSHFRRASISDRLAEIGDPRPGVGLRSDGLPDIIWCKVPAGKIKLEGIAETFHIEPFYISKYPITYIQFKSFVEAHDGYHNIEWWDSLIKQTELPDQYRPLNNHPVEKVSWYDVIAFCRWLSIKLNNDIRLPTEWEWQQAATGGNPSNIYPWGKQWLPYCANTAENGLSRTTAVGMYPLGASVIGALDMAGNVWEWCLNENENPKEIEIKESLTRAVRGGCWYHDAGFSVTSFRNPRWDYTFPRSQLRGFRIVTESLGAERKGATEA